MERMLSFFSPRSVSSVLARSFTISTSASRVHEDGFLTRARTLSHRRYNLSRLFPLTKKLSPCEERKMMRLDSKRSVPERTVFCLGDVTRDSVRLGLL